LYKRLKSRPRILEKIDLSQTIDPEAYKQQVDHYQKRLWDLEHEIYFRRVPVIILFEGWDAAGKGGNIKRLVRNMDPRGYEVVPVAAPNVVEKAHHYLWRFWANLPKAGHLTVFDRTGTGACWSSASRDSAVRTNGSGPTREINEMEEQIVSFGAVLVNSGCTSTRRSNCAASPPDRTRLPSNGKSPRKTGATGKNGTCIEPPSTICSP
jgi:polyphosphate kinase 2 (PPK2 family)